MRIKGETRDCLGRAIIQHNLHMSACHFTLSSVTLDRNEVALLRDVHSPILRPRFVCLCGASWVYNYQCYSTRYGKNEKTNTVQTIPRPAENQAYLQYPWSYCRSVCESCSQPSSELVGALSNAQNELRAQEPDQRTTARARQEVALAAVRTSSQICEVYLISHI